MAPYGQPVEDARAHARTDFIDGRPEALRAHDGLPLRGDLVHPRGDRQHPGLSAAIDVGPGIPVGARLHGDGGDRPHPGDAGLPAPASGRRCFRRVPAGGAGVGRHLPGPHGAERVLLHDVLERLR